MNFNELSNAFWFNSFMEAKNYTEVQPFDIHELKLLSNIYIQKHCLLREIGFDRETK